MGTGITLAAATADSFGLAGCTTAEFLGLRFGCLNRSAALAALMARHAVAPFAFVVTPNVDHVVRLDRRPDLRAAYDRAWAVLCDSRILARLAAWSGLRLPVIPGSDLTADLFAALGPGERIAIVGATADAVHCLRSTYALAFFTHHEPPMGFINDREAVSRAARFVADARARYVILALGSPQQELLALAVAQRGDAVGLGLCVGASLDFLTGRQRRAPVILQRLGLEWLFRLLSDPSRLWRRYLVDGPRIVAIYLRWRSGGGHTRA